MEQSQEIIKILLMVCQIQNSIVKYDENKKELSNFNKLIMKLNFKKLGFVGSSIMIGVYGHLILQKH